MAWRRNRIWGGERFEWAQRFDLLSCQRKVAQATGAREGHDEGHGRVGWYQAGEGYNPPLFPSPLHVLVPGPPRDASGDTRGEWAREVWVLRPEKWECRPASMPSANLLSVGPFPWVPGALTKKLLCHCLSLSQRAQPITLDSLHLCYDSGFWWAEKASKDGGLLRFKFPVCGQVPVPTASF